MYAHAYVTVCIYLLDIKCISNYRFWLKNKKIENQCSVYCLTTQDSAKNDNTLNIIRKIYSCQMVEAIEKLYRKLYFHGFITLKKSFAISLYMCVYMCVRAYMFIHDISTTHQVTKIVQCWNFIHAFPFPTISLVHFHIASTISASYILCTIIKRRYFKTILFIKWRNRSPEIWSKLA